jgi:translocation and assembly module TamB
MTSPDTPQQKRRHWALSVLLGMIAVIVVLVVASVSFLLSNAGLPFVMTQIVAQTEGRLSVEGASGSLASTMHFDKLTWRGIDSTTTATDVVVEWQPLALLSSHLAVRGLGAQHVSLAVKPSTGPTSPPRTLSLPLAIDIDHVAVATFDWQVGPRSGKISGIEFGYSGGRTTHRLRSVRLVSDLGALAGETTLQADAPFAVGGAIGLTGDGPLEGAKLDAKLSGTLSALRIDATGAFRDATLNARVALTPFAGGIFENAALSLANLDLAAFESTLPRTRLALELDVRPQSDGFEGGFRATNDEVGTLADQRLPLTAASGRYRYASESLALSDLAIALAGGGRANGEGSVNLAARDTPSRWRLDVHDLDLASLHPALVKTRLAGFLKADIDGAKQTIEGDVSQASLAVAFAAIYADRRVDITRFHARASGGTLTGSGRVALDGPRIFDVALTAQHFDPARFTALRSGVLDGTIKASGTLLPEWKTTADITLAKGSRYAGVALSGSLHGTFTRRSVVQASVDISAASARLTATGNAGVVGDRLTFALDAPRLAEIAPLLPGPAPQPLEGRLRAKGTLALEPGGPGGEIDVDAGGVRFGSAIAADKIVVQASFAPGGAKNAPVPLTARKLSLKANGARISIDQLSLASAQIDIGGTLADHSATLAARGADIDATVELANGALVIGDTIDTARWNGRLMTFSNASTVKVMLTSPATLEFGVRHARVTGARVTVADGHAEISEVLYDNGRLTSQGAFNGMALDSVMKLAGRTLPFASTLSLNGNWSIAALPHLSGTFAVRRAGGDVYAIQSDPARAPDLGLGIETLEVVGTLHDDALDAKLVFRSARSGNADGTVSLGSVAGGPPGRIAANAPLTLALNADLASLTPLQPWLGTAMVVNGNARVVLAGTGTLDAPRFSGTLAADALRIDAPQYGIALKDGRVRAHLGDGGIIIDEMSLVGGDGRFTASGTIGPRSASAGPGTQINWHAENFRVTNRPNLRLVVAGDGSLRVIERRLALSGRIEIVEGQIEYEPVPPGELGSDVVVVGRTTRVERANSMADLPLTLDIDVNLGNKLTFEGSGLDTSLQGSVHVKTSPAGYLTGQGTITAANGTYYAFGQKLTIDRGQLIFDGPLDNPALDVVALRKNLAVEAGVAVTGTVKVPRVRITSNPPVPENEALSWLIAGEPLSTGSRSDYAALAAASSALLSGSGGKPFSTEIAQRLGLDDISVRSGGIGAAGAAGTAGQVIVFGKRISERLSLGFEQGLSVASNALRLEYALTKTLTLRAEAGTVSGVGVYYRRTYN